MSMIDDFMSKVIDLDEKEKEETILFLANALPCGKAIDFIGGISHKVMFIVLPFLTDIAIESIKNKEMKGGEKVESVGIREEPKKV